MRAAVFAVAGSLITIGGDSVAAPISVDDPGNSFEVYHFRTNSGSNSAGFGSSDTITFGLTNVRPNGKGEDAGSPIFDGNGVQVPPTTGTAVQNGVAVDLEFEGDTNTPNLYSGGLNYDSNLTGQWTITLQNEADVLVVETPELGDVGIPERVTGVQLIQSGDPTTPTFTWQNVDPNADDMRLTVFDLSKRDLVGQAQAVYYSPRFTSGETSFTIPEGELEEGGL